MTPRLTPAVWISALQRKIQAEGGFLTVLSKGHAEAGSVILVLRQSANTVTILARMNTLEGGVIWQKLFENTEENDESLIASMERKKRFDPDLWIVELDIADPERFIDGDIAEH